MAERRKVIAWESEINKFECQCLCFVSDINNDTIYISKIGSPALNCTFEYSYDGMEWINVSFDTILTLGDAGEPMYFRGNNPNGINNASTSSNRYQFNTNTNSHGHLSASGNIMSLIDNGACNTLIIPCNYCFADLFFSCGRIVSAPMLPATTLTDHCYAALFAQTSIVNAPNLPATTVQPSCYASMFELCYSLVNPPAILPAMTLATDCYYGMFNGCRSMTSMPILPAATLAPSCYQLMFWNCSALVNIAELPAKNLPQYCYYGMFSGCNHLYISETPTTITANVYNLPQSSTGNIVGEEATTDMFKSCLGTRSSDAPALLNNQITYYTQNPPIF